MDISNDLGKRVELLEKNSHVPYDFNHIVEAMQEMCECIKSLTLNIPINIEDTFLRKRLQGVYDLAVKIREELGKT